LIGIIGICIIAGAIVVVTWWAYRVDKRERAEAAAAYKELYDQLLEKQKS